ncbi:hypothetical protein M569_17247 [Genlisea aurea]|uniref:Uncharacterized protein n=1 Tax=Genlisea aurea TaxID=192259 RepID=S8BSK7_9LAMI|nr:hypothetical protein M569_17247 [Genlisea aurea]
MSSSSDRSHMSVTKVITGLETRTSPMPHMGKEIGSQPSKPYVEFRARLAHNSAHLPRVSLMLHAFMLHLYSVKEEILCVEVRLEENNGVSIPLDDLEGLLAQSC